MNSQYETLRKKLREKIIPVSTVTLYKPKMTKLKQYLTSRKHEFPLPLLPKKQHLRKVVFKCLVSKWLVTRGRSVRSIPGKFACGLLSWFRKDKKVVSLVIGNVTTDLSSLPFCLYCCFPLVLNLLAAIFRFHFCRQTGLKPGCSVTHFREALVEMSYCTRPLSRDSLHPSISLQQ